MTKKNFYRMIKNLRDSGVNVGKTNAAFEKHEKRKLYKEDNTTKKKFVIRLGPDDAELLNDLAMELHPCKKNWLRCSATTKNLIDGYDVKTIDNGRYSNSYTYTHYTHKPIMTSWGAHSQKRLYVRIKTNVYRIIVRHGYTWQHDINGIKLVRNYDNADYHPDSDDVKKGWQHIVCELRKNAAIRKSEKRKKRIENKILGGTFYVCRLDAIRAGNCRAGVNNFADRKKFNGHVSNHVLKRFENEELRIPGVLMYAAKREIMELQRGYANLSDHY